MPYLVRGMIDVAKCSECKREFDLQNETDLAEYNYGHDCEVN